MAPVTVYGIPNCDNIKKTIVWLKKNKIPFDFHDYRTAGISKEKLTTWCDLAGWEIVLNKKSTNWRELPEAIQQKTTNQSEAIKRMMENTTIIKRPVIEIGQHIIVGFLGTEISKHLKLK